MENELIVLRACGFDQMDLARPALILAGALTVLTLVMTTWLSPKGYAEMQALRQQIKAEYSSFLLREGVFNTFGKDLTVYMRDRSGNGDLLGLMIHDTRDKDKPPVTITAKRGRLVMDGEAPNIIVFDGMRQQMDTGSGVVSKLFFARYTIEIKGFESTARVRWREANERTFIELLNPDLNNMYDRSSQSAFRAEAHARIITPFNVIGFTLVSLAALLLGPFNRRGQGRKVLLAALIVITLEGLNLTLVNAIRKNSLLLPLLYLATFAPIVISLYALHIRGEQKLMALLRKFNLRGSIAREHIA
jgi:lipopolysaccharide export system permease protein